MEKLRFIPLGLFTIFFTKLLFQPVSYTDASILLILGLVSAFFEFQATDKKVKTIEAKMDQTTKDLEDRLKEIESIKGAINSLKLSGGLRSTNASR